MGLFSDIHDIGVGLGAIATSLGKLNDTGAALVTQLQQSGCVLVGVATDIHTVAVLAAELAAAVLPEDKVAALKLTFGTPTTRPPPGT